MTDHPSLAGLPLVLGGNVFGFTADLDASFAVLDRFYEAGGRMVDTAQGYSIWVPGHVGGESETVIGQWLAARGVRAEMRIATKTGMKGTPGDLAPAKVRAELENSLARLQTDYVDLYYAHDDEPLTPQAEVSAGFGALQAEGLVRELGVSNFTLERLSGLNAAGDAKFTVLQNEYNLVLRSAFAPDLRDYCLANGVAHYPWMGLAAGFLTGKYRTADDLARLNRGSSVARFFEQGLAVLPVLQAVAAEVGASLGAVALAWLRLQPGITAPIASASRPDQLDLHFEALALDLSADQLAQLGAMGQ